MSGTKSVSSHQPESSIHRILFPEVPSYNRKEYGGECSVGWHVFEAGVHYGDLCTCGEATLSAANHAGQFIKTKLIL